MFHSNLNVPWKAVRTRSGDMFSPQEKWNYFVIAWCHVLWFQNQEYTGMYFEIFI